MDLHDISANMAELIPYENFKERIRLVNIELNKNRHVEVWDKYIYSEAKAKCN